MNIHRIIEDLDKVTARLDEPEVDVRAVIGELALVVSTLATELHVHVDLADSHTKKEP